MHLVKPIQHGCKMYECIACKIDQQTSLKLNKHILVFPEYKTFINTYVIHKGVICNKCNVKFVDEKYLKTHQCFLN